MLSLRVPLLCLFTLAASAVARADALPSIAQGTLRNGASLVAVSAPDSPWAVVVIAARVPDRALAPDARATLSALAHALAEGRSVGTPGGLDLQPLGGSAKASVDADTLAVALGAPADRLDDLLRAADQRLKARRALLPAQGTVAALPSRAPALSAEALALAAPSHADALPVALPPGAVVEPRALRELAEQLLAGANLRVVVVGPRAASELLQSAERALITPLAPGSAAASAHAFGSGTMLVEREDAGSAVSTSRLWFFCAADDAHGKAAAHAAVLAELVAGSLEWSDDAVAVVVDVTAPRASAAPRAEGRSIEAMAQLGAAAPPDEVVSRAKERVRAARLALWKDPEALALTLARAKDAQSLAAGLDALAATQPSDVRAMARRCAVGPRVVRRTLGAAR